MALEKLKYEDLKNKFEMEEQNALISKRCADEEKEKTAEQKDL